MEKQAPKQSKLESLASAWIDHFWSADHELHFTKAEHECSLWLHPNILLLGRIDAIGTIIDGDRVKPFFADWKTANPRKAKTWKNAWRLSPQALTYGVLLNGIYPEMDTFLIRQAFKSDPPTFDFEWFSYTGAELGMWRSQLMMIGASILAARKFGQTPWISNFDHCFRYGSGEYACPYFDHGCSRLNPDSTEGLITRISHLEIERKIEPDSNIVVLDATRVNEWLGCPEKYRKEYEANLRKPVDPDGALQLGLDFHEIMDAYYSRLISGTI